MAIAVGIDVGGTSTKLGAVTRDGQILSKSRFTTRDFPDETAFLVALSNHIDQLVADLGQEGEILGIGIGAPKANFFTGVVEGAVNLLWNSPVDLRGYLQNYFNVPVIVTNDANLAAVGEKEFGAARHMNNFLSVTIGTGLGCGIYMSGALVHGQNDVAGELGHTSAKVGGRECQCGKKGCLEAYVSAKGIVRTAMKLLSKYEEDSSLRSIPAGQLSPTVIGQEALRGDKMALLVLEFTGDILGYKLADMVAMFNPEAIFLAGGVANAGPLLLEPTLESIKKYLYSTYPDPIVLLPSALKDDEMAVLGGGALVWEHLENQMVIVN
ncbi:ROK family protein [Fulvivirga sp. 29W222]|uniref:ROK family protein n=1 Tax=Fulvivirga marina TaxID=2494733 RepID=A0A937KDV2_9BACT|nr:ROK family protein [Fulvivirga marina]MBL6446598.1 ROK family protein [Fulvivirga marina]